LAAPFSAEAPDNRLHNRRALQARANLPQVDNIPLVAMVSRLDLAKGLDITGHVIAPADERPFGRGAVCCAGHRRSATTKRCLPNWLATIATR
jgi:glycogen synthase